MIELTQEQWQAVTQEETPIAIEPKSQTPYVVVPKEELDELRAIRENEADAAYVLRIAWMRRVGLDEDEIAESIRDNPPVSVHEETKQLKALDSLDQITPPAEVLRKHAVKY